MADNASEEDVRRMCMDELCEILDRENVDYSALEDIEEIRDLVLQSIAQRKSPNNEGHSQKEVKKFKLKFKLRFKYLESNSKYIFYWTTVFLSLVMPS